ncbi:MAG: hypothetical protein AB7E80_01490 [Hyphomicrobiaceae bacterium]
MKLLLVSGALVAAVLLPTSLALADQTGLASMHDLRREGGRLCMSDHFHQGNSSGQRSKKAAMAAAIQSWRSFTDLEYGSDWAHFNRARSKSVSCSGGGSSWSCSVEARPCR